MVKFKRKRLFDYTKKPYKSRLLKEKISTADFINLAVEIILLVGVTGFKNHPDASVGVKSHFV